jgi:hypothetical protein
MYLSVYDIRDDAFVTTHSPFPIVQTQTCKLYTNRCIGYHCTITTRPSLLFPLVFTYRPRGLFDDCGNTTLSQPILTYYDYLREIDVSKCV